MPQLTVWRNLYRALLAGVILLATLAPAYVAAAPNVGTPPPPPPAGTKLVDPLQLETGAIRTLPKIPREGIWGIVLGNPQSGSDASGILIDQANEAVVYPTVEMLTGPMGTIQFSVITTDEVIPADAPPRQLLDSWPIAGPSRLQIVLVGNKLTLTLTDDKNQPKTIEAAVNWAPKTLHPLCVFWDAIDLSFQVDGRVVGKIEKPIMSAREPLAITLGNNREFQSPGKVAVTGLRLSTAREPVAPPSTSAIDERSSNEGLAFRIAQSYGRRMYPVLEQLRRQRVSEVDFAYGLAFTDIGDVARALQTVTPIANDPNNRMRVPAIFLRADLLTEQRDYEGAYAQLQVVVGGKDIATSIRAQVRQAGILDEQGQKDKAFELMSQIIAANYNRPEINASYLLIARNKLAAGDYGSALQALKSIGLAGAVRREYVAIGTVVEIKVVDPDLTVLLTDISLPVTVKAASGDTEQLLLKPAFSRGIYIGSIRTALGEAKAGDGTLQVFGNDTISVTYIDRLSPDSAGKPTDRTVGLKLATDSSIVLIPQAAVDLYKEISDLRKQNILNDRLELINMLPNTASTFFRDPKTGLLLKKGAQFGGPYKSFVSWIKPGQGVYLEVTEPDGDISPQQDVIEAKINGKASGKELVVKLEETGPRTGIFAAVVKTTPIGTPKDGMLEVAETDTVTATYVDLRPAVGSSDPVHLATIGLSKKANQQSQYLAVGFELTDERNPDTKIFVQALRVSNGSQLAAHFQNRDFDDTDAPDKVTIQVTTASGVALPLALTETGAHTGLFTAPFVVSTLPATGQIPTLAVKPGEIVTCSYVDPKNPTPDVPDFAYAIRINIAEDAAMKFERQVVAKAKTDDEIRGLVPLPTTWEETTALVPGSVYRMTLLDGDVIPPKGGGGISATVQIKTTNGYTMELPLTGSIDPKTFTSMFTNKFFVTLGDAGSPTRAFFSQSGMVVELEEDSQLAGISSLPALNIQGMDKITVSYTEPLAADKKANVLREQVLRVADDARISVLNMQGRPLDMLKPGLPFEVAIADANGDTTPKRDTITATVTSSAGDTLQVTLTETDRHSGVFSAIVKSLYGAAPVVDDVLNVPFDGKITVTDQDADTVMGTPAVRTVDLPTRPLSEAEGVLLTKVYDDPKFEVETLVHLGESLYAVGAAELATAKIAAMKAKQPEELWPRTNEHLQEAARLLERVTDRFPGSDYIPPSLFLSGKIRLEERKYDDAERLFNRVIEGYPDSEFVPQAWYQLVLLYYYKSDITQATEAAMHLMYGFPKNPLVADGVLRVAEYYYSIATDKKTPKDGKINNYLVAATIYKRVAEHYPDNPKAPLMSYRMATSYYNAGMAGDVPSFGPAVKGFLRFAETYQDHELADDAMYWAAKSMVKQNNNVGAFTVATKGLMLFEADASRDMVKYLRQVRDTIREANPTIEAGAY